MNDTLKLTDDHFLTRAHDLQEHLPLTAEGSCCRTDDLLNVLLGLAVNCGAVEAVCSDWLAAPDPETGLLEYEPAAKDREPSEQDAFFFREQLVTPRNCRAQCPMPWQKRGNS